METTGFIHSFQSMGAVDGPGLRFVVFLQGCPLRCAYCHNPDTWAPGGTPYTAPEIVRKVLRFRPYFGSEGGVTVSGGEALMQDAFVAELFRLLHEENIHTALDTSGTGDLKAARGVLTHTDLVICDIKFPTEKQYQSYCGGSLSEVQRFLKLTEEMNVPLWVRHVVLPTVTDTSEAVYAVSRIAHGYKNLEKIELLPFKKLCAGKYDALGIDFPFAEIPECTQETIHRLCQYL